MKTGENGGWGEGAGACSLRGKALQGLTYRAENTTFPTGLHRLSTGVPHPWERGREAAVAISLFSRVVSWAVLLGGLGGEAGIARRGAGEFSTALQVGLGEVCCLGNLG